jgi:putative membrane protein
MSFSSEDRKRIAEAIRRAESGTSGEIVCVLARTSTDSTALPILIAAVFALALPWLLLELTGLAVERILVLQTLLFGLLATVLCLPGIRQALIPRAAKRAAAHRAAAQQFLVRGIARTRQRTGILIFVSLAERYVRIIADDGIASRVSQGAWQGAVEATLAHARQGLIADGFIAAIEICGDLLAKVAPPSELPQDSLPDRVYVI